MMNIKVLVSLLAAKALLAESLSVITVDADQDTSSTSVSAMKIDKTEIENAATGNGHISSLLKTNANITVSDSADASNTAGEIAPGKISINEAPFYQNNFQIDGISNDSLLDPASGSSFSDQYDLPGNENEMFLDLDLIEEITVYDSNVPAEYGGFTGGVIDVKTIRAGAKPTFKASYKYTSDGMTKLHVADREDFEKAEKDDAQPRFDKRFYTLSYTTPIDDSNGLVFSYSRKDSVIPGAYFTGFRNKKRHNENLFLKWSHYFDDGGILDLSGTYAPNESTHHSQYVKDSFTSVEGGASSIKANYEKEFPFWNLTTDAALKTTQNSKDSLDYYRSWIVSSTKNWGVTTVDDETDDGSGISDTRSKEGGYGDIEKTTLDAEYNLKLQSREFKTGEVGHRISTGLELAYDRGRHIRHSEYIEYENATANYLVDCNGDTESCEENEQYFASRDVYQKDDVTVDMFSTGMFFEERLTYDMLEFTPGVRIDYNNYLKNVDVAYRFNGSIRPLDDGSMTIFAGWNRYYGKSFLGFKLREARLPYYTEYRTTSENVLQEWGSSSSGHSLLYNFADLDTPYTDETSIGVVQDLFGLRFNLKYLDRDAQKQFSSRIGDYEVYSRPDGESFGYYRPIYFTNDGYTKTKTYSLNIGPVQPIKFESFKLGFKFSTAWVDKAYNDLEDYNDVVTSGSGIIGVDGEFYFNGARAFKEQPRRYRMHLNSAFEPVSLLGVPCRVNLNGIVKYDAAYETLDYVETVFYLDTLPDGTTQELQVSSYTRVQHQSTTTLDVRAMFDFELPREQHVEVAVDVMNLLDDYTNLENEAAKYTLGRQIWLNLTYKM